MPYNSNPLLARQIETTEQCLVIHTRRARYEVPWDLCSEKLARASWQERGFARLTPSGYGIHWPMLDEDLAVEPLVLSVDPTAV